MRPIVLKSALFLAFVSAVIAAVTAFSTAWSSGVAPGAHVRVQLAKSAWVQCASSPEVQAQVSSVARDGVTLRELSPNLALVHQSSRGASQCRNIGIRLTGQSQNEFFVPKSAIASIEVARA